MLGRPKRDIALIRQVKEWVYDSLPVSAEATVSIMELECHEAGCPPLETVIAVMEKGKETRQWKLHKPMPEITLPDIVELATKSSTPQDT